MNEAASSRRRAIIPQERSSRTSPGSSGFDVDAVGSDHFGLVGLREQTDLIGADLQIESARYSGTRIAVRLRMSPRDFRAQSGSV